MNTNSIKELNMCFLLKHKSGECQKNSMLEYDLSVKKGPEEEYAEEGEGEGEHRSHGANPIWECIWHSAQSICQALDSCLTVAWQMLDSCLSDAWQMLGTCFTDAWWLLGTCLTDALCCLLS